MSAPDQEAVDFAEIAARAEEAATKDAEVEFEYETPEGNKAARSYLHGLRRLKGDVERARKGAKAELLRRGKAIDDNAKKISAVVEGVIVRHARPLEVIEEREEKRVEMLEAEIEQLRAWGETEGKTKQGLLEDLTNLRGVNVAPDGFMEFYDEAVALQENGIDALNRRIASVEAYERDQAELQRLRDESAAREAAEREATAQRAAEAEAAQQAQRDAQAAQERAEAAAKEATERAERAEREAGERAERARLEERQRIADEQAAAEEAERQRKAAEDRQKEEEAAAEAKRQADEALRAEKYVETQAAILEELNANGTDLGSGTIEVSKVVADAIFSGLIPNVTVSY